MSVEIPLGAKYKNRPTGRHKSSSSNNRPARPKRATKEQIAASQAATRAHQMVKVLDFRDSKGKVKWIHFTEWDAMPH
jgi:hypothetical protein